MTDATSPRRRLWNAALATGSVVAFLLGGLYLADGLQRRGELAQRIQPTGDNTTAATQAAAPIPPGMHAWLEPSVGYGPVQETRFGRDFALFAAGPSHTPPERHFQRILEQVHPSEVKDPLRLLAEAGPSASAILREQATVGAVEGVSFLLRLPPDMDAAREGRLKTEPGGIVLGYVRGEDLWEYLVFYFPQGLDLDAFVSEFGPPPGVFDSLEPTMEDVLHPQLAIAGVGGEPSHASGARAPTTVLCRAEGAAGVAIDRAAVLLERRGFQRVPFVEAEGSEHLCVLSGPRGHVWLTTPDRTRAGGMVTVMFDVP